MIFDSGIIDYDTGGRLLANDSKQISDCTGGRKGDAVRYCQSEQNKRDFPANVNFRITA